MERTTNREKLLDYVNYHRAKRKDWNKLLALPLVVLFTIYDIWMVEGLFHKIGIIDSIYIYHQATFRFLFPAIIIFISLILKSWRFFMYSMIGIYCGWLDILYYLLRGRNLPDVYTWLPFSPASSDLVMFAIVVLLFAIFIDVLVKKHD